MYFNYNFKGASFHGTVQRQETRRTARSCLTAGCQDAGDRDGIDMAALHSDYGWPCS